MNISIDTRKSFDKNLIYFYDKSTQRTRNRENFLNLIKDIEASPKVNILN